VLGPVEETIGAGEEAEPQAEGPTHVEYVGPISRTVLASLGKSASSLTIPHRKKRGSQEWKKRRRNSRQEVTTIIGEEFSSPLRD
jgi:hypothetical protein